MTVDTRPGKTGRGAGGRAGRLCAQCRGRGVLGYKTARERNCTACMTSGLAHPGEGFVRWQTNRTRADCCPRCDGLGTKLVNNGTGRFRSVDCDTCAGRGVTS